MDFQVQLQSIPSFEMQLCRERSGSTRPRLMDSSRRLRRTGSCVRCCRISNLPTLKKGFSRRCNGLRPTMTLLGNDCLGLLPPSAIDAHMRLAHMLHEFVYQLYSIVLFLNRVEDLIKSLTWFKVYDIWYIWYIIFNCIYSEERLSTIFMKHVQLIKYKDLLNTYIQSYIYILSFC